MNSSEVYSAGNEAITVVQQYLDDSFFEVLKKNITWRQNQIRMFGKIIAEPRLTCWFGPAYKYSGIHNNEAEMPDFISSLNSQLTTDFDFPFNSVLLNFYRNGRDYMGYHSDNEPEIDTHLIAGISLGAERTMSFKNKTSGKKIDVDLKSGSLILMRGMQENWKHGIPKRLKVNGDRISLTFRHTKVRD